MKRAVLTSLLAAIMFSGLLVTPRAHASDASAIEQWLAAERSAHGLNGLSSCPDLQTYAEARAAEQAAAVKIWHAPDLTSAVSGWLVLGEIVGRGTSIGAVNTAWSQSPAHIDKYLDPRFTEVGIGTAMGSDGWVYAAVIFRLPVAPCPGARFLGGAAPSPPAPAPAPPAPAPAPVADPAPATELPAAGAAPVPVTTTASDGPTGTGTEPDDLLLSAELAASLEATRPLDAPAPAD